MRIDDEIISFLKESMRSWRVELTCGEEVLGEVKIERGYFRKTHYRLYCLWLYSPH